LQDGEVGSEGLFFAQIFIYVSQLGFFLFLMKDWPSVKILLQMGLFVVFVAIITNLFVVVDYNYFGYFLLMCTSVFCFWNAIKNRKWTYILIAFFAIGTIGYSFTADYLFDRILQPHQQSRIKVLFGMEDDLSGAGYNVNQSKIAIGSGGFFGKGFLNGTQTKLDYVPEQDTDFIFCTVGEEWGFLGTVFVLTLYLIFICRIVVIAERQKRVFAQIYAYCVASIFLFHMFINVGMVIGLCPVIGIPLPFFSYGGSSLWGFTILTFVLLRLDAARYN
jgi:rod shape determining protein RodA